METNNATEGVFVNEPSGSKKMSFWRTLWLKKNCRYMSDINNKIYFEIERGDWMGFFCLTVGTCVGLLLTRLWNFGFRNIQVISSQAENILVSEKGFYSEETGSLNECLKIAFF